MNYQFALFLVAKPHRGEVFHAFPTKPHRGEVSTVEGRCVSIFRIIRSSVRFTWWGLSKWSRFHSERFPAFFCFFQKKPQKRILGWELKNWNPVMFVLKWRDLETGFLRSDDVFGFRWGLSHDEVLRQTVRFWSHDEVYDPMMFSVFGEV